MTSGNSGAEVVLRLDGISKTFGALKANDAISLTLHRGEVVALLGENGAGKTTLMNILFGHYVADAGSVEVFGQPLPPGQPRAAPKASGRAGTPMRGARSSASRATSALRSIPMPGSAACPSANASGSKSSRRCTATPAS